MSEVRARGARQPGRGLRQPASERSLPEGSLGRARAGNVALLGMSACQWSVRRQPRRGRHTADRVPEPRRRAGAASPHAEERVLQPDLVVQGPARQRRRVMGEGRGSRRNRPLVIRQRGRVSCGVRGAGRAALAHPHHTSLSRSDARPDDELRRDGRGHRVASRSLDAEPGGGRGVGMAAAFQHGRPAGGKPPGGRGCVQDDRVRDRPVVELAGPGRGHRAGRVRRRAGRHVAGFSRAARARDHRPRAEDDRRGGVWIARASALARARVPGRDRRQRFLRVFSRRAAKHVPGPRGAAGQQRCGRYGEQR